MSPYTRYGLCRSRLSLLTVVYHLITMEVPKQEICTLDPHRVPGVSIREWFFLEFQFKKKSTHSNSQNWKPLRVLVVVNVQTPFRHVVQPSSQWKTRGEDVHVVERVWKRSGVSEQSGRFTHGKGLHGDSRFLIFWVPPLLFKLLMEYRRGQLSTS